MMIQKEINLLRGINHENIVKIYGFQLNKTPSYGGLVIMEACDANLSVLFSRSLQEWEILKIVLDVAGGIEFLHSNGITHG